MNQEKQTAEKPEFRRGEKQIVDIDPNVSISMQNLFAPKKYSVKVKDQYIIKNVTNVAGKQRYYLSNSPYYFYTPMVAMDAKRFFEAKGEKPVFKEEI